MRSDIPYIVGTILKYLCLSCVYAFLMSILIGVACLVTVVSIVLMLGGTM